MNHDPMLDALGEIVKNNDTPKLPEPTLEDHEYELWGQNVRADFYTSEQLRAALAAQAKAHAAELEACRRGAGRVQEVVKAPT